MNDNRSVADPALIRAAAESHGVCVRPILRELVDTVTGSTQTVVLPCGSTRASACQPCAEKARRLRMQQCREGWHRDRDDLEDESDLPEDKGPEAGSEDDEDAEEGPGRRVRSTRRRQDAPDLPRVEMSATTVGKTLTSPSGRTYRPSMFLTLTLPSYGKVHDDGTPVDPDAYDYRRAALDAMHFSRLVDRFWQNLRRCAGYKVQYFSAVEAQRRLAPHLHAAVRGIVKRSVVLQVIRATYHQVWWPPFDQPVYAGNAIPTWDHVRQAYVCPWTGTPLRTWEEALDELDAQLEADPATRPAHVVRFGTQADYKWLIADSTRTQRAVGYLTKYLTKSVADTYGEPDRLSVRQRAHLDRLNHETRWLPCGPECANWLRYGIQPKHATEGLEPGRCPRAAHDPENLGYGGRRVLVSRQWTGKTLTDHKADRAEVVRQVLLEAGIEPPDRDRAAASATGPDGGPRYEWQPVDFKDVDIRLWKHAILASVREKIRWRTQYEAAKRAGPQTTPSPSAHPRGLPITSLPVVSGMAVKGGRRPSRSDAKRP